MRVESIVLSDADYGGALLVRAKDDAGLLLHQFIPLSDADGRTEILLDGRAVDRWELLRWFVAARSVRIAVTRDPGRYGLVVRVEFRSDPAGGTD